MFRVENSSRFSIIVFIRERNKGYGMPNISKTLFADMFFKVERDYKDAAYAVKRLKNERKEIHSKTPALKKRVSVLKRTVAVTGSDYKRDELSVVGAEYRCLLVRLGKIERDLVYARQNLAFENKIYKVAREHVK